MRKEILHSSVSSSEILEKGAVQNVREIPYWINISEQTGQFQLGERDFMLFFYTVEQLEVPANFCHYYPLALFGMRNTLWTSSLAQIFWPT
jgi:hypothetical protein